MLSTRPPHDQQGGFSRCAEEERPAGSPAHPPPHGMNPAEKIGGVANHQAPLHQRGGNPLDISSDALAMPATSAAPHRTGRRTTGSPPRARNPPALCSCKGGQTTCRTMPSRRGGCEPAHNREPLPASDTGRLQASAPKATPRRPPPQPKTNSRAMPIFSFSRRDEEKSKI